MLLLAAEHARFEVGQSLAQRFFGRNEALRLGCVQSVGLLREHVRPSPRQALRGIDLLQDGMAMSAELREPTVDLQLQRLCTAVRRATALVDLVRDPRRRLDEPHGLLCATALDLLAASVRLLAARLDLLATEIDLRGQVRHLLLHHRGDAGLQVVHLFAPLLLGHSLHVVELRGDAHLEGAHLAALRRDVLACDVQGAAAGTAVDPRQDAPLHIFHRPVYLGEHPINGLVQQLAPGARLGELGLLVLELPPKQVLDLGQLRVLLLVLIGHGHHPLHVRDHAGLLHVHRVHGRHVEALLDVVLLALVQPDLRIVDHFELPHAETALERGDQLPRQLKGGTRFLRKRLHLVDAVHVRPLKQLQKAVGVLGHP
mmetsp:Transcript_126016/g.364642  ORF Transcript_126016/g.364642 Transcript_126016/m.364642 type:complete len:371 (-) Transcript_126016:185-1297(-)